MGEVCQGQPGKTKSKGFQILVDGGALHPKKSKEENTKPNIARGGRRNTCTRAKNAIRRSFREGAWRRLGKMVMNIQTSTALNGSVKMRKGGISPDAHCRGKPQISTAASSERWDNQEQNQPPKY